GRSRRTDGREGGGARRATDAARLPGLRLRARWRVGPPPPAKLSPARPPFASSSRRPSQRPEEESVVPAGRVDRVDLPARPNKVVGDLVQRAALDALVQLDGEEEPSFVERRRDATDDLCYPRCCARRSS